MLQWLKNMLPSTPKATGREAMIQSIAEAYRLARRDRPGQGYQPLAYSGDAAVLNSHDMMHRRTRDLCRNSSQAKRIVNASVNLIIGTGMRTYAWPFLPSEMFEIVTELEAIEKGSLGPRLSYALESDDLFDEWSSDAKQFDVEGRLSWAEMQRMLVSESAQVGNGLLVRSFSPGAGMVPLQYQLLEREQLDQTADRPAAPGQNKIVGGVETDGRNRVVAYHIWVDHPHDFVGVTNGTLVGIGLTVASGGKRMRLPADRVIDLAVYSRPSASLGVSWLDACGQGIWDRDSYMDSEIRSAAVDAVFSFVAKLNDAEKYGALGFDDDLDDDDDYGNRMYKVGHSPVASVIGTDEELQMVRQTRPNKDAPPFIRLLDHDIASATPISYFTLTGDYSSANFSSSRAAKMDEDQAIQPLQLWFAQRAALRVRREFNAIAAASGLFSSVTPAEFLRNERTYQRFDAIGNGRDLLDPFKEGEARTARMRTGISTFKEECAKVGKHWIRVLMQIAVERKVSDLFGVDLDFSKSGSGSSSAPPQQDADQQAQEIADRVAMLLNDA